MVGKILRRSVKSSRDSLTEFGEVESVGIGRRGGGSLKVVLFAQIVDGGDENAKL